MSLSHTTTTNNNITNITSRPRQPIGFEDIVSVQGRYLVLHNGTERFFMRGMAFPIAPPSTTTTSAHDDGGGEDDYDEAGWIAVLEQLTTDTDVNAVRLYDVDCRRGTRYDGFLRHAASRGVYALIPFTTASGDGVLDRHRAAPRCYPRSLYEYGRSCVDRIMVRHANVLAGVVGNEVMNAALTWPAAPCVRAYARDLTRYAASLSTNRTSFPLLYAAQHDSPTADVLPSDAMKLTQQYLACDRNDEKKKKNNDQYDNDDDDAPYIDMFGINVESWCSSIQTFDYEEDGTTETSYHALYETLRDTATIPTVFSEMGCSRELFNRDNGLPPNRTRHWHQVSAVSRDMADTWSGFCAYAYDGNALFRMMNGAWNGHDVLDGTADYDYFRAELHDVDASAVPWNRSSAGEASARIADRPSCETVRQRIRTAWNVDLLPLERMPSYYRWDSHRSRRRRIVMGVAASLSFVVVLVVGYYSLCVWRRARGKNNRKTLERGEATETDSLLSHKA